MNIFKTLMHDMIEDEISLIEKSGKSVRLKTLIKKRVIYTIIFGALFAVLLAKDYLLPAFVDLVVYFIVQYNLNNVSVVIKLAKKQPDKFISDIIMEDMKI